MSAPALSILLPVRDGAATLGECLDSISRQTFEDYELLLIDDGSRDATAAIIRDHATANRRVRPLASGGAGLVAALNQGLDAARAPLVARMDADDRMAPDRLARQVEALSGAPETAILGSRVRAFPEAGLSDGFRDYLRWQDRCLSPDEIADGLYVESPLVHPSVSFRRDAIRALGGYRAGDFPEDYDLWLRARDAGLGFAKLPERLLDWRDHPHRLSRTDPRCRRDAFDRLRAAHLARDPRLVTRRDALVCWGAGRTTRKRVARLLAHGHRVQAWIDIDPRKIGNRLAGVPVHPPDWLERRPRPFVLCYVNSHGARDQIDGRLQRLGYRRGRDYLMVG